MDEAIEPQLSHETGHVNDDASQSPSELPSEIDISPEKNAKLLKKVIREGKGWDHPKNGDNVEVHYTGKLMDGTVFDSSHDRHEQFSFQIGSQQVIRGWEIAITTMKRGEMAVFTIAPELAYGQMGSPPKIPPNATLVFEIELFDWKLEDITKKKDNGVTKRIIRDGEGYDTPNDGSTCEVHICGKYKGRVFEERNVTFFLGEASEERIIDGVEIAVRRMKKGEVSEVHIKPQYAFGTNGRHEFDIPEGYDEVVYDVTLKSFEKVKESYEMDSNERIEQSELSKTKGTKYFRESKYKLAIKQYKRIVQYLGPSNDFEDDLKKKKDDILLAGHLNLAMCYLKMNEFSEVIKHCTSALEIDKTNEKGLFRRGMGYYGQNDYEMAKKDFAAVLESDSTNKAARNQIIACNNAIAAQIEREKKTYRNMFEIFAKRDSEKQAKKKDSAESWIKDKKIIDDANAKRVSGDDLSNVQMCEETVQNDAKN